MPRGFLNVKIVANTAGGEDSISLPITEVQNEAGRTLQGISVHGQFPGLVPPYEEHDARRKAGYRLPAWRALDSWDRALEVAQSRIDRRLEAEEYEAMNKK